MHANSALSQMASNLMKDEVPNVESLHLTSRTREFISHRYLVHHRCLWWIGDGGQVTK
jgi:hypothetical protein